MMQVEQPLSKPTSGPIRSPSSASNLVNQAKAWTKKKHRKSIPTTKELVTLQSGSYTQKMEKNPRWGAAVRADIKHLHHLGLLHKHGLSHRSIKMAPPNVQA